MQRFIGFPPSAAAAPDIVPAASWDPAVSNRPRSVSYTHLHRLTWLVILIPINIRVQMPHHIAVAAHQIPAQPRTTHDIVIFTARFFISFNV